MGILKTLIMSIILVMLLQVRVDNRTIENHILTWAQSTEVSSFLNKAASGAIEIGHQAAVRAKAVFDSLYSDSNPNLKGAKR